MTKQAAITCAPVNCSNFAAAVAVPPVAMRSSQQQHVFAGANGVRVHFHFVDAVFQRIRDADGLMRKLAALADRHETAPQAARDRAAENESTRFDASDFVDLAVAPGIDHRVDGDFESLGIAQQRGDVTELDARFRVVRNGAD